MRDRDVRIGEGRRLTAGWLNIMAAGIVSGGIAPVLTDFALEGWDTHARALLLLPCFAFALGLSLHLVGRMVIRERTGTKPRLRRFEITNFRGAKADNPEPPDRPAQFPTEGDIDAVLNEFGNDPREAIRALLCDVDAFAADDSGVRGQRLGSNSASFQCRPSALPDERRKRS